MTALNEMQKQRIKTIITGSDDQSVKLLIEESAKYGEQLASLKFATSQIRNIFGIVRSIEQRLDTTDQGQSNNDAQESKQISLDAYRELQLIKPKLAYQYGRASNTGRERKKDAMGLLNDILTCAIDTVEKDRDRFTRFVEFFEAILAYHRSSDEKKN
jgi:CRISPR-associated protein Csm2